VTGVAREAVATVGVVALLTLVHRDGWLGPYPLALLLTLVVLSQLLRVEAVNTAIFGDPQKRLWLRIGVHFACLLPALYLSGWGPVALVAFLALTGLYITWTGSRAWRPSVVYTVAGTVLGQAGILLGLIPSYLGKSASLAVWAVGMFGVVRVSRQLGRSVEQYERSERELREAQRQARSSESWFRALVQNVGDVIMVIDESGIVRYVSPSVQRQLGYQIDDVLDHRFDVAIDALDVPVALELWERMMRDPDRDHRAELRLVNADGIVTWHEVVARNMLHDPDIKGVVINHRDSHERRMRHDDLAYEAAHDPLTGLANRAELDRILSDALLLQVADQATGVTPSADVAVLYIDLDGFKPVNDRHGHEAGDVLLIAVARLLERSVLGADTVARVGGDEFVVVLRGVQRSDAPDSVAGRILDNLSAPVPLAGIGEVRIGASIGVAVAGGVATTAADLLRRADQAMYEAKRQGRNRFTLADEVRY
jgi:diguanylate cyclase (GGDEF)-like protein/PAS domain S-box-containing protein